jgi:SAM-dependent methyltransferase
MWMFLDVEVPSVHRPSAMDDAARSYWNDNADRYSFSHPLKLEWLAELSPTARLLDYGCGYGRTLKALREFGWANTLGVDIAEAMVARGRRENPGLRLEVIDGLPLSQANDTFDGVLLFAVLTTIPQDEGQIRLVGELARVLRPGGLLYVSDYLLQTDERNVRRYDTGRNKHGTHGVWDREDGGVFRHHEMAWLQELFAGFEWLKDRSIESVTMSGAAAVVTQILLRRR